MSVPTCSNAREFATLCLREAELYRLCENLDGYLATHNILLLNGAVGAGKTSLVKALVAYLNNNEAKKAQVTSPTFSLMQQYDSTRCGSIYHYDLYNKPLEDMLGLGLLDMLESSGLHIIEWGGKELESMLISFGFSVMCVDISIENSARFYKVRV